MSNLSVTQKTFCNVLFVTSQVRYVCSIVKMVAGYTGLPAKTTNVSVSVMILRKDEG